MAAKKKAEKAKQPPFKETAMTRIEVTTNSYKDVTIDVGEEGLRLRERADEAEFIDVFWPAVANLIAALTRAQEIHAGQKTAELPLFGAAAQDDPDDDLEDEEGDDDE